MTFLATTSACAPRSAAPPPTPTRRERRLQIALVLTLLVTYTYVLPRWADWNQNSRLDLSLAVSREGRLRIDTFHQNTGDKAQFPPGSGHYYSEKTIGTSLLALGPVLLADRLTAWPPIARRLERVAAAPAFAGTLNKTGAGTGIERVRVFVALLLATFLVVSVPSALLGGLLFSVLRQWLFSPSARALLVLGYGLGTPALAYAGAFYGHQAAAVFLFTAFALLLGGKPARGRVALAGLALGLALLLEYSSVLAVPLLALYAWHQTGRRNVRGALPLLAFLVPFSLQFAYNAAVFGSPLATGYRYTEFAQVAPAGFQLPTLASIYGVSVSPFRGIFFRSPVLLLALPGFAFWWRNAKMRAEWWFCLALILLFLLYNMSYQVWSGGFSVGPRHFVSALPFFFPPLAAFWQQAAERSGRPFARFSPAFLAGATILLFTGIVLCMGEAWATQGYPQETPGMTWAKHVLPAWRSGNIARNIGMLLGLHGAFSLAPLALLIAAVWGAALAGRTSPPNHALSASRRQERA